MKEYLTHSIRVIPNSDTAKIGVVKLIREYTGLGLREAKEAMDYSHPITFTGRNANGKRVTMEQFLQDADHACATVVIGVYPVPPSPVPLLRDAHAPWTPPTRPTDELTEIRTMRRELAALRRHLGLTVEEDR